MVSYLSQWLVYHILESDKHMAALITALQSGVTLDSAKEWSDSEIVNSIEGKGTTFTLYFPRATDNILDQVNWGETIAVSPVPLSMGEASAGAITILVVDDELDLLALAEGYLLTEGYCVLLATNGNEALNILKQSTDIDLLFSDIIMRSS